MEKMVERTNASIEKLRLNLTGDMNAIPELPGNREQWSDIVCFSIETPEAIIFYAIDSSDSKLYRVIEHRYQGYCQRWKFGYAALGHRIVLIGGDYFFDDNVDNGNGYPEPNVLVCDLTKKPYQFVAGPALIARKPRPLVFAAENKIYALAGGSMHDMFDHPCPSFEVWDLKKYDDGWSPVRPPPFFWFELVGHTIFDNTLYVKVWEPSYDVQLYSFDLTRKKWKSLRRSPGETLLSYNLRQLQWENASTVVNNKLYQFRLETHRGCIGPRLLAFDLEDTALGLPEAGDPISSESESESDFESESESDSEDEDEDESEEEYVKEEEESSSSWIKGEKMEHDLSPDVAPEAEKVRVPKVEKVRVPKWKRVREPKWKRVMVEDFGYLMSLSGRGSRIAAASSSDEESEDSSSEDYPPVVTGLDCFTDVLPPNICTYGFVIHLYDQMFCVVSVFNPPPEVSNGSTIGVASCTFKMFEEDQMGSVGSSRQGQVKSRKVTHRRLCAELRCSSFGLLPDDGIPYYYCCRM